MVQLGAWYRGSQAHLAVGQAVILRHPPLHVARVSTRMERACTQTDSLTDGNSQAHSMVNFAAEGAAILPDTKNW